MPEVRVDDLIDLWRAGAVQLPQVAVQYSELAGALHKTGLSEGPAFDRSIGGRGPLFDTWTSLRNTIQNDIAVRTHSNLLTAGKVLTEIADAYATTDYLNADELGGYQQAIAALQVSPNPDARPPSVPDAATSDDPHPEDGPDRLGGV